MKILPLALLALTSALGTSVSANVGVFTGSGHTIELTSTADVQLVSERVVITPGRSRTLFAGGLPLDWVDYDCTFELKNTSDVAVDLQVGFPLDSQFHQPPYPAEAEADDLVAKHRFIARDAERTYHTRFRPYTKEFGATFLWDMHFAPGETRTLHVTYGMNMSMTLFELNATGERPPFALLQRHSFLGAFNMGLMESFGYVTATGASWAGEIERAEFEIYTFAFEDYLDVRPMMEHSPLATRAMKEFGTETPSMLEAWPSRWFRRILPKNFEPVPDEDDETIELGVRWTQAPFEPGPRLDVRYFKSQIPSRAKDVTAFCRELLSDPSTDLALVRQVFGALSGIAPENADMLAFVETQLWYAPVEGRTEADLDADARAVLAAVDAVIAEQAEAAKEAPAR